MKLHLTTRQIVFAALMIAATLVLEQLRIFHMPQGGSVTLGGMVPLILLAYLEGPVVGAIGGCLYGFLNMMQDPYILHPVQVLFDYPLPYMCMGLAGLLPAHRIASTALAFVARFACHFISGVVFFASYAPEGMNPAVYSMVFNATYLVPDFIICFIILKLLPIQRFSSHCRNNKSLRGLFPPQALSYHEVNSCLRHPLGRLRRQLSLRESLFLSFFFLADDDAFRAFGCAELDADAFVLRGRDILADVVSTDWQLAMAAVDEDGELDSLRTAHVDEGVKRGTNRTTRVEDVIDEDDMLARDVDGELGLVDDGLIGERGEIIAVERDVEDADRRFLALDSLDFFRDALGDGDAARADADEDDVVHAFVLFENLVGDAREGAADGALVHEDGFFYEDGHKISRSYL